ARDIDFRQVLAGASGSGLQMQTTHGRHLNQDFQASGLGGGLKYRTPDQVGIDGNTVDPQRESAEFAKNAMDFAASFRLLNGRFASLSKAIKGE
ncbi:MAG: flagellar basal body rod protein FlgB, partial [Pseudomonadales bacterium]|nr:flagellar basal body rod protein FlgB [Pseudomonadales bacterium]